MKRALEADVLLDGVLVDHRQKDAYDEACDQVSHPRTPTWACGAPPLQGDTEPIR